MRLLKVLWRYCPKLCRLELSSVFLSVSWQLGVNIYGYPALFRVDSKNVIYNNEINWGAVIVGSGKLTQY